MSSSAALKAQKRQKFERVYEVIREELLAHFNGEGMPKEAAEWYRQVRTTSSLTSTSSAALSLSPAPPTLTLMDVL